MHTLPRRAAHPALRLLLAALAALAGLAARPHTPGLAATDGRPGAPNERPSPVRVGAGDEAGVLARVASRPALAPAVTARSAVLVDLDTGRALWTKDPEARLPMASTTKLMTCLLALELAALDEVATVYPRDLLSGSTMSLRAGERITVANLIAGAMIASGNDAAYTLADHVGRTHLGGVGDAAPDAFVARMNREAREMGLSGTRFANPEGFDEAGHYSTARDLATLGRAALAEPFLARMAAARRLSVTGYVEAEGGGRERVTHDLAATNELLGAYRGANGVKTGTTARAGEMLIASVRRDDAGLLAVVMGASDRYADIRALFAWGLASHRWVPADGPALGAGSRPRQAHAAVPIEGAAPADAPPDEAGHRVALDVLGLIPAMAGGLSP